MSAEEKKLYADLTRTVGLIQEERKPVAAVTNEEGKKNEKEEGKEKIEEEGEMEAAEVKPEHSMEIRSIGRQRYGDTRSMPFYSLKSPVLAEFQR